MRKRKPSRCHIFLLATALLLVVVGEGAFAFAPSSRLFHRVHPRLDSLGQSPEPILLILILPAVSGLFCNKISVLLLWCRS
jgi:hypothetical protein